MAPASAEHHAAATLHGNILTPGGWLAGSIQFEQRIDAITGVAVDPGSNHDVYILPGFIDLHVHGAGGKDTMEAGDAAEVIARMHAQHGTTSMLATTMTAPIADIENALARYQSRSPTSPQRYGAGARCASRGSIYQSQ